MRILCLGTLFFLGSIRLVQGSDGNTWTLNLSYPTSNVCCPFNDLILKKNGGVLRHSQPYEGSFILNHVKENDEIHIVGNSSVPSCHKFKQQVVTLKTTPTAPPDTTFFTFSENICEEK